MTDIINIINLFKPINKNKGCFTQNQEIISQLKFVSRIQPGELLNVKEMTITKHNWFSAIYRRIFGESRIETFNFINSVIERSFEIIQVYISSVSTEEKLLCAQLLHDMIICVNGLEHLQETYKDDRNFHCQMECLIEKIRARLTTIKTQNPHLLNDSITKEVI